MYDQVYKRIDDALWKDAEDFAVRGREAKEAFRRIAWRIKRQKGW